MDEKSAPDRHGPTLEVDDEGIGWITFDDPDRSHNILTEGVMHTLAGRLEDVRAAVAAGSVRALVIRSGKAKGFMAGADMEGIARIEDPVEGEQASRLGQAVFLDLEQLPVPTVAAIDGICVGGGTEMALACRYRLASDSDATRIGLPEVQLGILPAWGGTTRLPRLVGLRAALEILLSGDPVPASRARRIGLVDEVLPRETFGDEVRAFVRARLEEGPVPTGAERGFFARLLEDTAPGRRIVLRTARKRVLARTDGHYPAPLRILDVVGDSLGRSVEKAFQLESAAAGELIASTVSKNLIHVFQLRERARKEAGVEGKVKPRPVEAIAILGAGVMGGGIAQLAAWNEIPARMKDIRHEAVSSGLREARKVFDGAVERRKIERREADRRMELISGGLGYEGFGRVDLVVEAVVERMEVKRSVLAETEERVSEGCVLATNTSSLSVDEMAEALERPERFCGMHFFNPVHRMPLVEVVRGARTDDVTVATAYALALRLGKVPVVTGDGPGFLVNRILGPYLNEAGWLLVDGARVEDVDGAAENFGMPMGPLRLVDEVGVDIARHAGATLHEAFGDRMEPAPPLVALAESGRLGRKGGLGFYRYEDGEPRGVDDEVYEVLGSTVPDERRSVDRREIRARLILVMINEAARVLSDGIVERAGDVDLGMIMGTGFPPFRGGLLRYADHIHPRTILDRLREYRRTYGPRFEPAALLVELGEKDQTFYGRFGD